MEEMTATKKAQGIENGDDDGTFDQDVLYVRMCDVAKDVRIDRGAELKFRICFDVKGAGAYEVEQA